MCVNCNCAEKVYDNCVFYTGVDVPELCIKKGDSLAQVEDSLIKAIQLLATGEGTQLDTIIIDNTTLEDILNGKEPNVNNIIQALITYSESLEDRIEALEGVVDLPITVNAPCLTLPSNPTKDDILKATAEKLCTINTSVNSIASNYVKATELCDLVADCIEEINSNPSTPSDPSGVQEYTKMPKYAPIAYLGPLSVFDSTGKGIASQGYDKVYICNGNNGTRDLRGMTLIGANTNISGGVLDPSVDPAATGNAGYTFSQGTIKGRYTHSLTANEGPVHNHNLTDPGHRHLLTRPTGSFGSLSSTNSIASEAGLGSNSSYALKGVDSEASTGRSSSSTTGITIASSGSGNPHNNLQPSFGVVYIIYLP